MKKDKTEKFVKIWSLKRSQGKNKYIITNSIRYIIGVLIVSILVSLYTGNDVNLIMFIALSIGGIIGNILVWYDNEKKYNDIVKW